MTQTGAVSGGFDWASAYHQSFGTLPDKTVIVNHFNLKSIRRDDDKVIMQSLDLRPRLADAARVGLKALSTTTGGVGTAGVAMVPVYVDPQIVDLTRKETPLVELFPRVTNQGLTADFLQITAKGGAFTAIEDASLSETNTTTIRQSETIKYVYSVGRVTGPAQASYPSFILQGMNPTGGAVSPFADVAAGNAKQLEVLVKTKEIRELEENLIVAGNKTTNGVSGNIGPNGSEFDGFVQLIGATNKRDKNTSALDLDDINISIQSAFDDGGRPNLAVCASSVFTDLLGLLTAKIGYMQSMSQVFWGFSTIVLRTAVGEVPVIQSRFMSNTSGSKSIYFLDMSIFEMRILQDLTFENLAKTNDSDKFMLKMYECMICRAAQFNSWIGEIE